MIHTVPNYMRRTVFVDVYKMRGVQVAAQGAGALVAARALCPFALHHTNTHAKQTTQN